MHDVPGVPQSEDLLEKATGVRKCRCNHFNTLHNKTKDEFYEDGKWKAVHGDGCRAANCKCFHFDEKRTQQ